jgi:phage-related protein
MCAVCGKKLLMQIPNPLIINKLYRYALKNFRVGLKRHCLPHYLEIYFHFLSDDHVVLHFVIIQRTKSTPHDYKICTP